MQELHKATMITNQMLVIKKVMIINLMPELKTVITNPMRELKAVMSNLMLELKIVMTQK